MEDEVIIFFHLNNKCRCNIPYLSGLLQATNYYTTCVFVDEC